MTPIKSFSFTVKLTSCKTVFAPYEADKECISNKIGINSDYLELSIKLLCRASIISVVDFSQFSDRGSIKVI